MKIRTIALFVSIVIALTALAQIAMPETEFGEPASEENLAQPDLTAVPDSTADTLAPRERPAEPMATCLTIGDGANDIIMANPIGNVGIGIGSPGGKLDVYNGALTLSSAYLDINRDSYSKSGISWYSQSYPSWSTYMSPTGTNMGPHGDLTAPSGTYVTSWALRNYIENSTGYGWTFESAANTTTPAVKFEICSSDGTFHSYGNGYIDGSLTVSGGVSGVNYASLAGIPTRTSWSGVHRGFVAEQLSWKNYGNSHTIFDASAGTSPDGGAVNNTNPDVYWTASYPTLMGWNGSNTYGVRVDVSRYAESAYNADLLDSQHGSYYDHRNYTVANNYLGGYYVSGGSEKPNNTIFGPGKLKVAMLSGGNLGFGGSWNDVLWMSTYSGGDVKGSYAIVGDKYSDELYFSRQNYDSGSWGTGRRLLHTGNASSIYPNINGDNLGNHTATQNLNMNYLDIRNIDDLDGAESGGIGYIYLNWNCADGGNVGVYNSDLRLLKNRLFLILLNFPGYCQLFFYVFAMNCSISDYVFAFILHFSRSLTTKTTNIALSDRPILSYSLKSPIIV